MWIIGKYRADGSIYFADKPAKHKTLGDAIAECERLVNENKGVTLAVFELVIERQVVDVERDKFGREIVRRNGDIILVKAGNGYTVCKENGRLWYCCYAWQPDQCPHNCAYATIEDGITMFNKAVRDAAATPLPTAKVDSPKPDTMSPPITAWQALSSIEGHIATIQTKIGIADDERLVLLRKIETLTADLERYRERLASIEGKVNK